MGVQHLAVMVFGGKIQVAIVSNSINEISTLSPNPSTRVYSTCDSVRACGLSLFQHIALLQAYNFYFFVYLLMLLLSLVLLVRSTSVT